MAARLQFLNNMDLCSVSGGVKLESDSRLIAQDRKAIENSSPLRKDLKKRSLAGRLLQ